MKHIIQELVAKENFVAVGLMSGTSMDGVDAAIVKMTAEHYPTAVELVAFETTPYPTELREALRGLAFGEQCTAEDIALLHTGVAVAFSNAFFTACRNAGLESADVDFIGSHGQTVAHVPPGERRKAAISGTLQLGAAGVIASLTGVTTVADFRVADMALGGQGAPLVPYVDHLLRSSDSENRIMLNIGGIANVTYLPKNGALDEVIAFDTGPGNMVLDELYRVLYPNEEGYGKMAECLRIGRPSMPLVESFLRFAFFGQKPPKSAGHREFGGTFAWKFLSKAESAGVKREDILASAVSLTAQSIQSAIKDHVETVGGVDRIFVTGGGSQNRAMMIELATLLAPAVVGSVDELGVPADAKEAVDFAVLARETILSRINVVHRATGAARPTVLGTIALGVANE
jgi:anhydro-N-acetylmuramic acid kinase